MQRNNYSYPSNTNYYSNQAGTSYSYPSYAQPTASIYQPTNTNNPIVSALQNLNTRINNALQRHSYNRIQTEVLTQALTFINNMHVESMDNSLLLDLYLTINTVFDISTKNSDLTNPLKKFFARREDLLCGDSHDYCYSQSLANQFCQKIAAIVFPHSLPLNVLLEKARTQNRSAVWQDATTLETELESAGDFFRTKDNCIHLYRSVMHRTLGILKRGYFEMPDIWCGSDVKNLKSLDAATIGILKQRTPTLRKLVQATEDLSTGAGFITKKLADWRLGLQRGAIRNGDNKIEAGRESYKANKEFFDWWNELSNTTEGKAIRASINRLPDLGAFIASMSAKDSIDNCVDTSQVVLEELLGRYRNQINKIESPFMTAKLPDDELENMAKMIDRELEFFYPIVTNKNVFADLCQNKELMDKLAKRAEYITYDDITPKPTPKLKQQSQVVITAASKNLFDSPVIAPKISKPEIVPLPTSTEQPNYHVVNSPIQKHGFFKHFRERREEKKHQKQMQKYI